MQVGDPDADALARLTLKPVGENQNAAAVPARDRLPDALNKDWDDYLERFTKHYELTPEQQNTAKTLLDQQRAAAVHWLLLGEKEVEKPLGSSAWKAKMTTPERVAEYRAALDKAREIEDRELYPRLVQTAKEKKLSDVAESAESFAKSMTYITRALSDFLDRYAGKTFQVNDFSREWKGIVETLSLRIRPSKADAREAMPLRFAWTLARRRRVSEQLVGGGSRRRRGGAQVLLP
jgi:rubrerythrin